MTAQHPLWAGDQALVREKFGAVIGHGHDVRAALRAVEVLAPKFCTCVHCNCITRAFHVHPLQTREVFRQQLILADVMEVVLEGECHECIGVEYGGFIRVMEALVAGSRS